MPPRRARPSSRTRASSALLGCCALAWASAANAQSEQAIAQSLFDQALKLMNEGKYQEACPKLAESQRLDPGGGTLINLGLCREKEGKLGSAWAAFTDALALALRDGRKDRESIAKDHLAAIEPKLQRVAVNVSALVAQTPKLEVKLDDAPLRSAAWGVPTPVDAGLHTVTASAPGKISWRWDFEVKDGVAPDPINVPALKDVPVAQQGHRSAWPWVLGGVGVAGIGVGVVGGVVAIARHADANSQCMGATCATQDGVNAENAANTAAWVSNIGLIAGAVTLGVAVLWFVLDTPKENKPAPATARFIGNGLAF